MPESVNIEVYHDGGEIFAVISEHRPDLPKPVDQPVQEWAKENFGELGEGTAVEEAGELIYEPNGEIIEIRRK